MKVFVFISSVSYKQFTRREDTVQTLFHQYKRRIFSQLNIVASKCKCVEQYLYWPNSVAFVTTWSRIEKKGNCNRIREIKLFSIEMDVFAVFRKHLATGGIEISQKLLNNHPINVKNAIIFILVCVNASFTALTLTSESSFDECTDILFRSVSLGVVGILYEIIVWNTAKLFEFIDSLADTVKESE